MAALYPNSYVLCSIYHKSSDIMLDFIGSSAEMKIGSAPFCE
jgi:hypothetical protein